MIVRLGILITTLVSLFSARIHDIQMISDPRPIFPLMSFGLTTDGFIEVNVTSLAVMDPKLADYGMVIECSETLTASQYMEDHINICHAETLGYYKKNPKIINLAFNLDQDDPRVTSESMTSYGVEDWQFSALETHDYLKTANSSGDIAMKFNKLNNGGYSLHFQFKVYKVDEGQYTLYFYRCPHLERQSGSDPSYTLTAQIVAMNGRSYLSVGEKPLILIYTLLGLVYLGMSWAWIKVMLYYSANLFKIHYLMAALVIAKFLACILHSIDFYFISSQGTTDEAWAILWYIIHLVRGLLLFISLALIGMGFAFVKHVLSYNEKLILATVVPLQVVANVAYIIIDSSEETALYYGWWKKLLIFVDLVCCGAIIFPIMWSIRHLQQATERSDNKTALILSQLKLFRRFYILVVVYIYVTRIALEFLKVVLPFQYVWCSEFLRESSTIIFFLITGFKFRPYVANPYYKLVDEEDEDEFEMAPVAGDRDTLRSRRADGTEVHDGDEEV